MIREPHGFVLGLPLTEADAGRQPDGGLGGQPRGDAAGLCARRCEGTAPEDLAGRWT